MYKQYKDKNKYTVDLLYINNKTREYFTGCIFQDVIKHPLREEYYINLSRIDILNVIQEHDLSVVTPTWLSTDIIAELPDDFNWLDQTRPYRLVCDTLQIIDHLTDQTELGILLDSLLKAFVGQVFRVNTNTFIYLANLDPYQGINVQQLLIGYPDTFLRIENQ